MTNSGDSDREAELLQWAPRAGHEGFAAQVGDPRSPAATAEDGLVVARPAVDPALPATVRRYLGQILAAAYHGDPAEDQPLSCWANPCAGAYRVMRMYLTAAHTHPRLADERDGPWVFYVLAWIVVGVLAVSAAHALWPAALVTAVATSAPAAPDVAAAYARWHYRGRYITHPMLSGPKRALLLRAQTAIDAITVSADVLDGQLEDPCPGLGWHEWEIATILRDLSPDPTGSPVGRDALQSVTSRVVTLEACAAAMARAADALRARDQDLASSETDPGLAATAAAAEHRIKELDGLAAAAETLTSIWTGHDANQAVPGPGTAGADEQIVRGIGAVWGMHPPGA